MIAASVIGSNGTCVAFFTNSVLAARELRAKCRDRCTATETNCSSSVSDRVRFPLALPYSDAFIF